MSGRCRGRRRSGRAGFTLIELMVAIMILSVALLGLGGMSVTVLRQLSGGGLQTRAAMVVQSRFDSLASISLCETLVAAGATRTGAATTLGIAEAWVLRDGDDVIHVSDTVRFRGRTRPLVYRSILPCRD